MWWRRTAPLPAGLEGAAEGRDLTDEKMRLLRNLRRLRYDHAEGRIAEADYHKLESEYQQQLAAVMDELERQSSPEVDQAQAVAPRKLFHRAGSLVLLLLVAVPALYIFNQLRPPLDETGGKTSLEGALAQLEKRLADNPGVEERVAAGAVLALELGQA